MDTTKNDIPTDATVIDFPVPRPRTTDMNLGFRRPPTPIRLTTKPARTTYKAPAGLVPVPRTAPNAVVEMAASLNPWPPMDRRTPITTLRPRPSIITSAIQQAAALASIHDINPGHSMRLVTETPSPGLDPEPA